MTGALYSNDRERIARARRDFYVGNLYINRKCTGAFVDVHPFGGFNMSGTDSKVVDAIIYCCSCRRRRLRKSINEDAGCWILDAREEAPPFTKYLVSQPNI